MEFAFEYDVPAIFDLTDGVDARQLDLPALLGGEFRAEDEGPVVKPLANDVGAELIGGGLEGGDVVNLPNPGTCMAAERWGAAPLKRSRA
jgi:hypothetical protein